MFYKIVNGLESFIQIYYLMDADTVRGGIANVIPKTFFEKNTEFIFVNIQLKK